MSAILSYIGLLCALTILYWVYHYFRYQKNLKQFQHVPGLVPQFFDSNDPLVLAGLVPLSWITYRRGFSLKEKFNVYIRKKSPMYTVVSHKRGQLMTADPEVIKQITVTQRQDFPKPDLRSTEMFGPNLVSVEGEIWKRHRKVAAPTFSDKNYRLVSEAAIRVAHDMFKFWETNYANDKQEITTEIHPEMLQVALAVVSHAAFGQPLIWHDPKKQSTFGTVSSKMSYTFQQSLDIIIHNFLNTVIFPKWLINLMPFGRLRTLSVAQKMFQEHMKNMVTERNNAIKEGDTSISTKHDLLTNLVTALKENEKTTGSKSATLSEKELYGNLFIFIFAGHETTAATLAFSLILLACYPNIQQKLYEEVKKVLGDREPTYDDYPNLLYPQFIMKETLRLYPPVTVIGKKCNKDTTLNVPLSRYQNLSIEKDVNSETTYKTIPAASEYVPVRIPKDTSIQISIIGTHHNSLYWPKSEEFIPERFDPINTPFKKVEDEKKKNENPLNQDDEEKNLNVESGSDLPYHRQAFMPFSDGIRSCIGRKFSEVEYTFILTLIIQRYSFTTSNKFTKEQALEPNQFLTLRPKHPVELVFTKRERN